MRNQFELESSIPTSLDPFLRYWIKIYDLSGPVHDLSHPAYLAQVFVATGANCNTIIRTLFEYLIDRGWVLEL